MATLSYVIYRPLEKGHPFLVAALIGQHVSETWLAETKAEDDAIIAERVRWHEEQGLFRTDEKAKRRTRGPLLSPGGKRILTPREPT